MNASMIMGMVRSGIDEVQTAMATAKVHTAMKVNIGEAITEEQQIGLSQLIDSDPTAYYRWLRTDAGRAATRVYVDAILGKSA